MGDLGDLSPEGSIAVGVVVGVISTSVQSLGLTLQRKSHMLEDERDDYDDRRPPYRRRRWQIGMFMFIISNIIGSTIQITTLPLPVLSTLQASGLVFNTLFATLILGEPFTRHSFFGTLLVCTGAVLIAIFGAISDPAHNLKELILLLKRWPFILWMVLTVVLVILTFIASRVLKSFFSPTRTRPTSKDPHPLSPTRVARVRLARGLMFGFMSGVLSAHSLLMAKSAVELVVRTIVDRENQFNRWQSWIILLALIFFALSQLYYLHRGLKLCSTSVLYPFVFCIYNIIAILDGLIYFHQTSQINPLRAGLIALGTVVLLSGVLALSWRLDHTSAPTTPGAALTPGMGAVDAEESSSPTTPFKPYQDEEQPLLPESRRRLSLSRHRTTQTLPAPDPSTELAQIWAELDDSPEDDLDPVNPNHTDEDTLASLPHSPPKFPRSLNHRRSNSLSSSGSKHTNLPYHSSNRSRAHHSAGNLSSGFTSSRVRTSSDASTSRRASDTSSRSASPKVPRSRNSTSSNKSTHSLRLDMKKNRRRKSAPGSSGGGGGGGYGTLGDGVSNGIENGNGASELGIEDGVADDDRTHQRRSSRGSLLTAPLSVAAQLPASAARILQTPWNWMWRRRGGEGGNDDAAAAAARNGSVVDLDADTERN